MKRHTTGASGPRDRIFSGSLVAGAVKGVFFAAGALGLGCTNTASVAGGLAAGRGRVNHFGCGVKESSRAFGILNRQSHRELGS